MPLQFLAPLFLAAAAAIAVPLILHLIHREQREATPFPSLMFLRRIPHRTTRRRRLRDLPLLALRVLVLLLLAAAFARPLLEREAVAAGAGGPRELVVLLDRSYSMARGDAWERAVAAVHAELEGVRSGDRASVIAFDAGAAALAPPTDDAARLRALLAQVRPGAGGTRFDPALRLAASVVAASPHPEREVVVVSDLQRAGAGDGVEARLPAGTAIRIVPIAPGTEPNLAVADVAFARDRFEGQERVTATARIVNPGAVPAQTEVTIEVGGRALGVRAVRVEPHGVGMIELPAFTLAEPARGRVHVRADALAADDAWHFALAPDQALRVLLVTPDASAALFVERALEVAEAPGFRVTTRRDLPASLAGFHVAVLNGTPLPDGAGLDALRSFVERGGGLIAALGPRSGAGTAAAALLPGSPAQLVDRTRAGGGALGYIDLEHGALEIFRAPRSGDLTAPRFYRYRPIQVPLAADSSVRVLARFDDGSAALAERRLGRGRVLAFASTLDRGWNDLPVRPVFVPLVHRLASYAAGIEAPAPAHRVGGVVDARAAAGTDAQAALLVVSPAGARTRLEPGARALPLAEAGWYTVRAADRAEDVLGVIASNVDVQESDPAALEPAELEGVVAGDAGARPVLQAAAAVPIEERERRQALWWYLLAAAAVLLAVETVLSNRRQRAAVRVREGR